jgi:hypothetical protein
MNFERDRVIEWTLQSQHPTLAKLVQCLEDLGKYAYTLIYCMSMRNLFLYE